MSTFALFVAMLAPAIFVAAALAQTQLPPPADQTAQGQLPNPAPPQLPPGVSVPPQETRLVEQALAAERARAYL